MRLTDILGILAIVAPEAYRVFRELNIDKSDDKELLMIMIAMLYEDQRKNAKLMERILELDMQNGLKIDQLMRR